MNVKDEPRVFLEYVSSGSRQKTTICGFWLVLPCYV